MITNQQVYTNLGPTLKFPERYYGILSATLVLTGIDIGGLGLILTGLGAFPGASALSIYRKKDKVLQARVSEIDANPDKYPLEHIDGIVINDINGLDMLLEKTSKSKGIKEWATYIDAEYNKDTNFAEINKILTLEESRQKGMKYYPARCYTPPLEGFSIQHYHPKRFSNKLGAWNYAVHNGDRMHNELNTINLLTFNLENGPELIGYNTKYTYIPIDSSKEILVRADDKQITAYLRELDSKMKG